MLFMEALEMLKSGKDVSRQSWSEEDGYLTFMSGMKHIWKILIKPQPNAGNHIFSVEELLADDWSEFDSNKFAEKKTVGEGMHTLTLGEMPAHGLGKTHSVNTSSQGSSQPHNNMQPTVENSVE